LSKDLDLYKKYASKIKEPIEKFIYSIINIVGRNSLKTRMINTFMKNFKKVKRGPIFCMNDVIKILFTTGKSSAAYKNLKNALNQIINNITVEPIEKVVTKINESVLFFYNASSYQNQNRSSIATQTKEFKETNTIKKMRTNRTDTRKITKKEEEKKVEIPEPFISEPMTREFCLVLDIDETISHTMKLSFGNYFLLRPGVIHLIRKLYHFFEIDIFTAAIKRYADNIVDKLDPNDEYINYRFYREHCIYEGTKTVKKLVRMGRELNKIIFVDNIKYNAKYNMDNLYHVSSWKDDVYDEEMIKLQDLLIEIIVNGNFKDDIRKGIAGKDDQGSPPVSS
jgi:TFIIF-interacting CTD phosphatase-like protein